MSNAVATGWPSGSGNLGWGQEPTAMLMPGRVQGWPAGTQRAANPATQLLTQAVAYWDVASYQAGDRFLRNLGTAGELLNLRLGSSIIANSNDPEYLPVSDVGYVWLSGVAGNSLTVTAPATATNFVAYPLDRSVANTTGAVTGGATFTFSTTGSWRLIELRDASNVVVDTIDCDVITTGSATSFTSGIVNQTVTINRSTSGRKATAVPSRSKGGSPVMLLGTDDRLEIPDDTVWQNGLLNFDANDSFTVLAVARRHLAGTTAGATPGYGVLVSKRTTFNTTPGHEIAFNVDKMQGFNRTEAGNDFFPSVVTFTYSSVTLAAMRVSKGSGSGTMTLSLNANSDAPRALVNSSGSLWSSGRLRIGGDGNPTPSRPLDAEFYAAAIFRRVLSAEEITRLTNYFTGRIA